MKNTVLIATVLLFGLSVSAQTQPQSAPVEFDGKGHYLNVDFGVGLSSFMFKLDDGKREAKLGFSGKIGYDYYFTNHWGIGTGLGISWYKTAGLFNNHLTSYDWMDDDQQTGPNPYRRDVYLRNWEEIQKTLFFEIPLLANYHTKFGEKKRHGIYANAGLRFQLPLKSTFSAPNKRDDDNGLLEVQGYYKDRDLLIYFEQEKGVVHGFGFHKRNYNGTNDLKMSLAATAGVGGLFGLTERLDLYAGVRIDYGFLNIKTDGHPEIITGDLNEYYGIAGSDVTEKVNPFSIRGEVGLRLRLVGKKKAEEKKSDALERPLKQLIDENAKAAEDRRRADDDRRQADDDRRRADDDRRRADDDRRNAEEKAQTPTKPLTPGASRPSKSTGNDDADAIMLDPLNGYPLNVAALNPTQKLNLDKKIRVLKDYPELKIRLIGHACDIGSHEANDKISHLRAQVVRDYLVAHGIESSRILEPVGYEGKRYQIVENTSETNRRINRRVEFVLE